MGFSLESFALYNKVRGLHQPVLNVAHCSTIAVFLSRGVVLETRVLSHLKDIYPLPDLVLRRMVDDAIAFLQFFTRELKTHDSVEYSEIFTIPTFDLDEWAVAVIRTIAKDFRSTGLFALMLCESLIYRPSIFATAFIFAVESSLSMEVSSILVDYVMPPCTECCAPTIASPKLCLQCDDYMEYGTVATMIMFRCLFPYHHLSQFFNNLEKSRFPMERIAPPRIYVDDELPTWYEFLYIL